MSKIKRFLLALVILLIVATIAIGFRTYYRYQVAGVMDVPLQEFTNAEYPENPAGRSVYLTEYQGRRLKLEGRIQSEFPAVVAFRSAKVALICAALGIMARYFRGAKGDNAEIQSAFAGFTKHYLLFLSKSMVRLHSSRDSSTTACGKRSIEISPL